MSSSNNRRITELLERLDQSGSYADPNSRESIVMEIIARALVQIADRPN